MSLIINLNRYKRLPLHRQIYCELRQLILLGKLPVGRRIISTRALARQLAVSRFTVSEAYHQLLAEGYLVTYVGSGTYVSTQLPEGSDCVTPVQEEFAPPALEEAPKHLLSNCGCFLTSQTNFAPATGTPHQSVAISETCL